MIRIIIGILGAIVISVVPVLSGCSQDSESITPTPQNPESTTPTVQDSKPVTPTPIDSEPITQTPQDPEPEQA